MKREVSEYLRKIGAKGGKASKRTITPEQQAKMQRARRKATNKEKGNARS